MTNRQCTICTQPLLQQIKNLSQSFNQKLLEPTKPSTSAPPNNDLNQGTDEDEDPRLSNRYSNINESYQSEALQKNITDTLKSYSVPHSHQSQTQLQTQDYQQTQAQKQQLNNPSLALFRWHIITKTVFGSSIIWCFPSTVSQSTPWIEMVQIHAHLLP